VLPEESGVQQKIAILAKSKPQFWECDAAQPQRGSSRYVEESDVFSPRNAMQCDGRWSSLKTEGREKLKTGKVPRVPPRRPCLEWPGGQAWRFA
jgi:hypothetical protein